MLLALLERQVKTILSTSGTLAFGLANLLGFAAARRVFAILGYCAEFNRFKNKKLVLDFLKAPRLGAEEGYR